MPTQKIYAYVDETGQDATAAFFYVVAAVNDQDQERLREQAVRAEDLARTGHRKWHKTQPQKRLAFLTEVVHQKLGHGDVFFGAYPKPIPYFFPVLDVLEHALRRKVAPPYVARIHVDGIDRSKALQLTNALRARGVTLELVRSRRDESEPLIRLADMWAGCIRAARSGRAPELALLERAQRVGYLAEVTQQKPLELKGFKEALGYSLAGPISA
jgi:hypothetical protein